MTRLSSRLLSSPLGAPGGRCLASSSPPFGAPSAAKLRHAITTHSTPTRAARLVRATCSKRGFVKRLLDQVQKRLPELSQRELRLYPAHVHRGDRLLHAPHDGHFGDGDDAALFLSSRRGWPE